MIYREWKDFILDIRGYIDNDRDRLDVNLIQDRKGARLVLRKHVEQGDERFEVMSVNELGQVIIWTTNRVLTVTKLYSPFSGGWTEKLHLLMRNPFHCDKLLYDWRDFCISSSTEFIRDTRVRFEIENASTVITRETIERDEEKFQAMLSERGNVFIWTTTKTWGILQEIGETFVSLPRNPPNLHFLSK